MERVLNAIGAVGGRGVDLGEVEGEVDEVLTWRAGELGMTSGSVCEEVR